MISRKTLAAMYLGGILLLYIGVIWGMIANHAPVYTYFILAGLSLIIAFVLEVVR